MAVSAKQIRENWIDPKQAARHAAFHLHMGILAETPGMTGWRGAGLGTSTVIFDLNGQPLFYDFVVLSPKHDPIGTVRASASRVLGAPVFAVYLGGPRWDLNGAVLKALTYVTDELGGKVTSSRAVCYAYPKLGIQVNWEDPGGRARSTLVDAGDGTPVKGKGEPGMRGEGLSPFYKRIPEAWVPRALKRFDPYDNLVEKLQNRTHLDLAGPVDMNELQALHFTIAELIRPLQASRVLTFCGHGFSHECFRLHSQPSNGYCTPATGQMILDFWRYYHSVNGIAAAMKTSFATTWTNEVAGLESLTCSHFEAQSDMSPGFDKVKAEIDANRPFDYSYDLHSTACVGYREIRIRPLGTVPERSVYLYDPWPSNAGTIRWETYLTASPSWGPVEGFVYLRRP